MSRGAKKKEKGKKQAPPEPCIRAWTPAFDSNGVITNASEGWAGVDGTDHQDMFILESFALPGLAYYAALNDPVAYVPENGMAKEGTLRLLNKGKVVKWSYDKDDKEYKGTIARGHNDFTDVVIEEPAKEIKVGTIVEFTRDEEGSIVPESVRPAKPTVEELPEERRKKIQAKFDEIADGGLATQSCKAIPTWTCPYCTKLNFSELRETKAASEEETSPSATTTRHILVCQNPGCGAPRPQRVWSEAQTNQDSHTTYKLCDNAPEVWTVEKIKRWRDETEGHTTYEQLIQKAVTNYSPDPGGQCLGCGKPRKAGSGCEFAFDAEKYPPLSFLEFYRLGEGSVGKVRQKQLEDVLNAWPPCACGLLAIPAAPLNLFRAVKTHHAILPARGAFEHAKDKVRSEIIKSRVTTGKGRLFASISTDPGEQSMLCHIVPLQAGGCKTSLDNIVWRLEMCPLCQNLDKLFTAWQSST